MGRKRQRGILETSTKSLFRTASTAHHKANWISRKQKVVKHHDTEKKKTYTYSSGFFANTTKTKTPKTIEVREN